MLTQNAQVFAAFVFFFFGVVLGEQLGGIKIDGLNGYVADFGPWFWLTLVGHMGMAGYLARLGFKAVTVSEPAVRVKDFRSYRWVDYFLDFPVNTRVRSLAYTISWVGGIVLGYTSKT